LVIYTTAATTTFYVGSAFVAFKNQPYNEFFQQQVPGGPSVLQYAEDHNWDTLTTADIINFLKTAPENAQKFVNDKWDLVSKQKTPEAVKDATQTVKSAALTTEERLARVGDRLKTKVHKVESQIKEKTHTATAVAQHQANQFSEGVEELVRKAEEALKDKAAEPIPEATTTPAQPEISPPDQTPPVVETETKVKAQGNVYEIPLPIGHEPPPGYSRPQPPPKPTPPPVEAPPAPAPLPLIAPAVSELATSEPIITQLASTIDNLAVFLNANPTAAEKAHDVLDTARIDLTELASRMEKVKEDERIKLEQKLDDQAREYTVKLLELEMSAQDKLDNQEEDFRKLFDQERMNFIKAYREKLNNELQTQSELINERLKEEVIAQGIEMQRRWIREIKVRVEQERGGRLATLDELSANPKRLERGALHKNTYLDENIRVHALWSAIRALNNTTLQSPTRKPFREELRILRHLGLAKDDPVVSTALDTLEASHVPDVGIEPLADLATWFSTTVMPKVTTVALVPDEDAGVLSHLASNLFSSFRFKRQGLVPGDDVLSVLSRAEYHLNEKDLDSAARELNQLKGSAKVLVQDWLKAARERLEVEQALDIVQSQATFASLLVV